MSENSMLSRQVAPSADFEGALQDLEVLAHEALPSGDEEDLDGTSGAPTLACLVERLAELGRHAQR